MRPSTQTLTSGPPESERGKPVPRIPVRPRSQCTDFHNPDPAGSPRRVFISRPPAPYGALGGTSSLRQALLEPLLMEGNMRRFLIAALFAIVPVIGPANAADGCGPGCHSTSSGACVVDGWGTGAPVWNECPAGARARPRCGYGYAWRQSMRACFPRVGPNG